jgi:hypothetical protein
MDTPNLYEEIIVFILLLLSVVGIYILLKLHYIFAFNLVKNTSLSEEKKQKIDKIKNYLFAFLKVLLVLGLLAMFTFAVSVLNDGGSLKATVIQWWKMIPEGFWSHLLWTLLRIAILIILMRYILKKIFIFIDGQKEKTLAKKCYTDENVEMLYLRIHNTIKFTVVLGIVYRIIHFFPFLEDVSHVFLFALILFFVSASLITIRELVLMLKTKNNN